MAQGNQNAMALAGWLSSFLDQQQKLKDESKSADYFFKANPKALETLGIHPDAYGNMGSREKVSAMGAYARTQVLQQAQQEQQQRAAESVALVRQRMAPIEADDRFMRAVQQATQPNAAAADLGRSGLFETLASPQLLEQLRSMGTRRSLPADQTMDLGMEAGVSPERLAPLGTALAHIRATEEQRTAGGPEMATMGKSDVIFNRKTGAFQISPFSKAEAQEGTVEVPDPKDPVFGPKIHLPLSVAKKDYPHLLDSLKPGGQGPSAAGLVQMRDPQGNRVNVPGSQLEEFLKKGYRKL